jgi:hypothetical protein
MKEEEGIDPTYGVLVYVLDGLNDMCWSQYSNTSIPFTLLNSGIAFAIIFHILILILYFL